jgi:hypothetical protein
MAAATEIRHDFDMAGRKIDMSSGSRTLLAPGLPLVKLQSAQTGSAMRSYYQNF